MFFINNAIMKKSCFLLITSLLFSLSIQGCSKGLKPDKVKNISRIDRNKNVSKNNYSDQQLTQISFDEYSIIFAFSDTNGKDILAISDTLPDPKLYTHTISEEGKIIPVTYRGKKSGDEEKDFQQVYSNFTNCSGYLFETGNQKVGYKNVNILMTDDFLKERKYIKNLKPENKFLDKNILDSLESQMGRKIKNSFPIAKIDNRGSLYAVNYELSGDTALFSFVFVTSGNLLIKDNYGEYDPGGTWRAGDNGYVKPGMFEVLAAFQGKDGIEFAIDWKGSEGDYIEYLVENGNVLEMAKNEYRYTLPN